MMSSPLLIVEKGPPSENRGRESAVEWQCNRGTVQSLGSKKNLRSPLELLGPSDGMRRTARRLYGHHTQNSSHRSIHGYQKAGWPTINEGQIT